MPVQSGKLKQRVTIKARPADNLNTYGEEVDPATFANWDTVETTYAQVEPLSALELRLADSDAEMVIYKVKMRYRDNLEETPEAMLFEDGDVLLFEDGDIMVYETAANAYAGNEMLTSYSLDWSGRWLDVRSVIHGGMNNREFTVCMCRGIS